MSLYRKYRPQTFEDVVGQEHVARTLRNALTANPPRVAHAYLFTGPRGIGKTTNARLLAKCLNCQEGPTPVPCNKCSFCTRVAANQSVMDLIEIDAASNTQVDKVRETIIDKVNVSPAEGRYRIYIIDEVHMLSNSSFNALLKTLEEPPPHAVFVLATTEYHKVPPTITSRCQRFDFRRVGPADIVKRLMHVAQGEGFTLHEEAARLIARHAEGALRDALTLLEQVSAFAPEEISAADVRLVLGGVPQEIIHTLVECMANGDAHGVLATSEAALEEGASFSQLARDLTAYLRDLMLLTVGFAGDPNLPPNETQLRGQHAQRLGRQRLEAILGALREAAKEMRENVDHRLILELALVRATEPAFGMPMVPAQGAPAAAMRPAAVPPRPPLRAVGPPAATPGASPVSAPPANTVEAPSVTPAPSQPPASIAAPTPAEDAQLQAEPQTIAPETVLSADGEAPVEAIPSPSYSEPATEVPEASAPADAPPMEVAAGEATAPKKKGRRIRNFEELMELWPAVVVRIRKRLGVTAVAFFHDAYPAAFTDEEVVLEFKKEFHFAKTSEAAQRLPFEQIINETFDKPRRLKFRLAAPPPKPVEAAEPEPDSSEQEDEELMADDDKISDYAQTLFAAEVMGRSGL